MISIKVKSLLFALLILHSTHGIPAESNGNSPSIKLDKDFFRMLRSEQVILRDEFLNKRINSTVSGSGVIESSGKKERYGKNFLVIASDKNSGQQKLEIKYHIYTESNDKENLFIPGGIIEFRGTLILHTPLNTGRNRYIFDILLDKGAYIVK